jgi:hypothetical protein
MVAYALAASVSAIGGPALAQTRGVVELFTSQGCSSCPPADQVLGELALDPTVVALSLPIDYWDYLGWKDTLAKPRHSARQRAYAQARGDREVYTPQAVVNGTVHVLGSDKAAIERAMAQTRHAGGTLSLPVTIAHHGDKLDVTIEPGKVPGPAGEIWMCPVARSVPVEIGRGENHGRTLAYHNVVRRWIKLGDWTGAARDFSVPVADLDSADAAVVIVQAGTADRPGAMLGAALVSTH